MISLRAILPLGTSKWQTFCAVGFKALCFYNYGQQVLQTKWGKWPTVIVDFTLEPTCILTNHSLPSFTSCVTCILWVIEKEWPWSDCPVFTWQHQYHPSFASTCSQLRAWERFVLLRVIGHVEEVVKLGERREKKFSHSSFCVLRSWGDTDAPLVIFHCDKLHRNILPLADPRLLGRAIILPDIM